MFLSVKTDGCTSNKHLSDKDSLERGDFFLEVGRAGKAVGLGFVCCLGLDFSVWIREALLCSPAQREPKGS